ncbi:MAG: transposase [Draconibacterium sp.]
MENELKTNARKLSPSAQYEIRKSIIRMSKHGKRNHEIAGALDVGERHVRNVKGVYAKEGIAGIKPKTRGRRKGENRVLNKEQEQKIQSLIVENDPDQLKLPGCMWMCNQYPRADKMFVSN